MEFAFEGTNDNLISILRNIIMNGIPIYSFAENEGNLEEIFMTVTGGEKND